MEKYFSDIVGNDTIRRRLGNEIISGTLPHAFIIEGKTGSGRRTLALRIAAALACTDKNYGNIPCGKCDACEKILNGKTPDVIHIRPKPEKVSIGVEASRFIRSDAMTVPNDFEHKVYIVEFADLMTEQAQNALLLTLEDPHSYAVFILLCSSASALLETVRSRAPIFRTEPVERELLISHLISRDERAASMPREELEQIAADSEGFVGRALTLLNPDARTPDAERAEIAEKIVRLIIKNNSAEARTSLLSELSQKREAAISELLTAQTAMRDLILLKKSENAPLCFWSDREDALELVYSVPINRLLSLFSKLDEAIEALHRKANVKLTLTLLLQKDINRSRKEVNIYGAK